MDIPSNIPLLFCKGTPEGFVEFSREMILLVYEGKSSSRDACFKIKEKFGLLRIDFDESYGEWRSDLRIELMVDVNLRLWQTFRWFSGSFDETITDAYPCQELIRCIQEGKKVGWKKRWKEAGGRLHDNRMIAPKDDPIWGRISFFRLPYIFDFNGSMDLSDIDRAEAESVRAIKRNAPCILKPRSLLSDVNTVWEREDELLRFLIEKKIPPVAVPPPIITSKNASVNEVPTPVAEPIILTSSPKLPQPTPRTILPTETPKIEEPSNYMFLFLAIGCVAIVCLLFLIAAST